MADFTGSAADDVFNAPSTSATTGAAVTTVNSGDAINGGAGIDTLNITASATNNNSLTGLTATSIEKVNITDSNNIGTVVTSTAAAAAVAGAAQVAVIDLVTATPTAEIQTVNFGDLTVATAGGITVAGVAVALAVGDTGKAIADKVVTALKANTAFNDTVASYSVTGGVLTVNFKASVVTATLLNATAILVDVPGTGAAAFATTTGVTAVTGVTVLEAQAASQTTTIKVSVNGTDYSTTVTTLANQLSTVPATKATADATVLESTRTAVKAVLANVLGGTATIGDGDNLNEVRVTSKNVGQALPLVSVAQGTTSLSTPDGSDPFAVTNVEKTGAQGALSQILGITVDDGTTADFDGTETFELFVNGVSFGVTAIAAAATEGAVATAIAGAINAVLGTGVATANGALVSVTAPTAGTALPHMNVKLTAGTGEGSLTFSEIRANQDPLGTTTTTTATAATVSAATAFADATEVNLLGTSGSTAVTAAAGQTIGFNGVTAMANTVTFAGTTGSISSTGSTGALTIGGTGLTSLSLAGTTAGSTTTALSLTEGATATTVDTIKALNVSTSGSTVLNTTGLSALTSVTQTGAGGVTLNAVSTATQTVTQTGLATITTGAGADSIRVTTAVAADLASTTINETVTAVVSTGGGNDRVIVATGATATNGITTVDLGDGNDTLILASINTGANTLSGGAGDDVFRVDPAASLASTLASTSISGGAGTDVLRTNSATFSTADYTTLSVNVSSVETLQLTAAATLDASRVAMGRIEFFNAGNNVVTEVASAQSLAVIRTAVSAATIGIDAVATAVVPTNISASSKGYLFAAGLVPTAFGENINLTMTNVADNSTAVVAASALTLSVAALGQTVGGTSATDVAAIASKVTLGTSDVQTLTATLTSARGSGTRTDLSSTGLGTESMAALDLGTVTADNLNNAGQQGNLQNLTTVTVSGAGVVTINAGAIAAVDAKLATINLSGMTAFADLNNLGQEVAANGTTVGGYNNKSTSSVTLNTNVAETVLLGGAKDTVVTGSTIVKVDTITGFQVVVDAVNPLIADATRSDVLNIAGNHTSFSSAIALGTAGHAAKMTVTGSTLEAALLQASNLKGADGTTNVENVVFHFGGNTYVYSDVLADGLSNDDALVQLSGTLNLDLLLTSNTIV